MIVELLSGRVCSKRAITVWPAGAVAASLLISDTRSHAAQSSDLNYWRNGVEFAHSAIRLCPNSKDLTQTKESYLQNRAVPIP